MLRRATTGLLHRRHPLSQCFRNTSYRCLSSSTGARSQPERKYRKPSSSSSSSVPKDKDDATPIIHGRTRSLRPMLVPPSIPPNQLLPVTSVHGLPASISSDQNTEKDLSSFSSSSSPSSTATTVTVTGLPPNTVKTDIRPVFQRFGEITRIYVLPDGRRADVVFMDAHCVKRTLHAYAEKPLRVRGKEIIVFRKQVEKKMIPRAYTDASLRTTRNEHKQIPGGGAIFVSNFPPAMTQEELFEALEPFGVYERYVMRPGSRAAYFIYSSLDPVKSILSVHGRVPISIRGTSLRIERAENRSYSVGVGPLGDALELGKTLDQAASSATLEELGQTVKRFKGSNNPARVIWIGGLPNRMSQTALTNFWSRLGCVVDVRPTSNGYAHVEFASIEDAVRAVRQGAPHGFRYRNRSVDVDFAPWEFFVGPVYRAVYISGWPAFKNQPALLKWTNDIPNIAGATVLPPFRGEKHSDPRSAILRFRMLDDARVALRKLDGRLGPGGETLQVGLSRPPVVHLNRLLQWIHAVEDAEKRGDGKGEACLEDEWGGFGFGTGEENQDGTQGVEQ